MDGLGQYRKIANPGLSIRHQFGKVIAMRNEARGDVWKVWLYAAATVALGAWISPWLYNAGKALAEVSSNKTTNGPLEWLAGVCRTADFPRYYEAGLLLAAAVLFFPWLEWLHAMSGKARRWRWEPVGC